MSYTSEVDTNIFVVSNSLMITQQNKEGNNFNLIVLPLEEIPSLLNTLTDIKKALEQEDKWDRGIPYVPESLHESPLEASIVTHMVRGMAD